MEQTLAQVLQATAATQQQLTQFFQEFAVRQQEDAAAMRQTISEQTAMLHRDLEERSYRAVVDRGIGKPQMFSGSPADWTSWSFKFETWIGGQFEYGQQMLAWARNYNEQPITEDLLLAQQDEENFDRLLKCNNDVYAALVSLCNQGSEALDIVRNSRVGGGIDAWRRLNRRYDPNNPT